MNKIPGEAYDEPVFVISAGLLWERLGRELTDDEKEAVAEAIQWSSIYEALDEILAGAGMSADEETGATAFIDASTLAS